MCVGACVFALTLAVCVCVCVYVYHVSSCSITTPTVQTASELEGLQTDLWVLSASSSVSIRVVIESCEFVSFTQIYWNDIHLLSALGTHFRLHFEIRALCCFRAAEKTIWETAQNPKFKHHTVFNVWHVDINELGMHDIYRTDELAAQ